MASPSHEYPKKDTSVKDIGGMKKIRGLRTSILSFFFLAMTDSKWILYGLSLFFLVLLTLGARPVEGAFDPARTILTGYWQHEQRWMTVISIQ